MSQDAIFGGVENESPSQVAESNREKAQIAHDLRSPLAALEIFLADILRQDAEKGPSIRLALDRLAGIANNLAGSRVRQDAEARWIAQGIRLGANQDLVIADDDASIHAAWDEILRRTPTFTGRVHHLYSPGEFSECVTTKPALAQSARFLVDHEFAGSQSTGLDLIEQFDLSERATLVTSRSDETVLKQVRRLPGLQWLLKSRIPTTKIEVAVLIDAVLIDNDPLMRATWAIAARNASKKLITFESYEAFQLVIDSTPRSIPIYIDQELEGDRLGSECAQELRSLGFERVVLATGHHANFAPSKDIQGKMPPW